MIPPLSLWVHVESPEHRNVRIWLPLFLVWLLLVPVMVLAFAITIVVDIALYVVGRPYHRYTLLLLGILGLVSDTRGTVVRINNADAIVDVTIW